MQPDALKSKYNCNNGTECASLTGLFECSLGKYFFVFFRFNCFSLENQKQTNADFSLFCGLELGHCRNVSMYYSCQFTADGITIDAERDNMKLNGFFDCKRSRCVKLNKSPVRCDRFCPKVTTTSVNILIMQDDSLVTAECDAAFAYTEARGDQPGIRLTERKQIWNEHDGILLTNCYEVFKEGDKIR